MTLEEVDKLADELAMVFQGQTTRGIDLLAFFIDEELDKKDIRLGYDKYTHLFYRVYNKVKTNGQSLSRA